MWRGARGRGGGADYLCAGDQHAVCRRDAEGGDTARSCGDGFEKAASLQIETVDLIRGAYTTEQGVVSRCVLACRCDCLVEV